MKKRILSLLLALVLIVGLLPTVALASSGSVDVYIIGRDELITYQKVDLDEAAKIDVSSYGAVTGEGPTAMHAIVAALREANMLNTFGCTGGYISQIGDLVAGQPNYMSGWMYKLNNVFPDVGVAESSLTDGDEIVLFWEQGVDGQQYCQFKEGRKAAVKTGEALTLTPEMTLLDVENGLGKELTFVPAKTDKLSFFVYVDGELYKEPLLNSKGNVSVTFATPGRHVVTAKVVYKVGSGAIESYLTLPVCVVDVAGDPLPTSGALTKLIVQKSSGNEVLQEIPIVEGVRDYYMEVPYEVRTCKIQGVLDETATANKASMAVLYTTKMENPASGMVGMPLSRKGNPVNCINAFYLGDNEIMVSLSAGDATHAVTSYMLHVYRAESSPNAQLNALDVKLGDDELCKSAEVDQITTMSIGVHLKLFYQKKDGSTASCVTTKPDATARDYTVYVPYETEQVEILPTVVDKGTYTLVDDSDNVCDSSLVDFKGDTATYFIDTVSSNGQGKERYTLTLVRRPNFALTGASIDCGRLWLPGVVPGYNKLSLYVTDTEAEKYTATFTATPGTKLYIDSIAEENLLSNGKVTRPTPHLNNGARTDEFTLLVVGELADGSAYVRKVKINVEESQKGMEMVEFLSVPSQHMVQEPEDTVYGNAYLSAFGGYMTLYFKDPIKNDPNNPYGLDFYVNGNPQFPNVWSFSEPAQIYVAQDKDGDGEPDKWYALAGSEHYEDTTIWDYEITYTDEGTPSANRQRKVRWDDNQGNTGYVCGLSSGCSGFPSTKVQALNSRYRTQYQPGVLTVGGILIGPIKSQNMIYAPITIFGYGDCYPASQTVGQGASNPYRDPGLSSIDSSLSEEDWEKAMTDQYGTTSHGDGMDISWAVDEDGNPVYLDEISFVRTMSAINVDSGIFSEKSPEIFDFERFPSDERREQPVGISDLPDQIVINGKPVDLSKIHPVNGQATATVYLAEGEESAAITVEAGDRNVILGNRYRKSYTYETVSENGRLVRIITQDGEKAPNILVLHIQRYSADHAAAGAGEDLIDAIGEVTLDSGDAIKAAREAYDALTDEQKELVGNYQTLLDAEARYEELTRPSDPGISVAPSKPSKGTLPFADVGKNDDCYDAVKYLYENEIMNGTSATQFSPNAELTRGMVVTILYRMEGEPFTLGSKSFSDVKAGRYYSEAVEWAAENGIVNGFTDGTFKPDQAVTREQLASILRRYASFSGIATYDAELPANASVSNWAKKDVAWAYAEGILTSAQTAAAAKNANRAEVAMAIYAYLTGTAR